MGNAKYQSWGRYPKCHQQVVKMLWRHEPLPQEGYEGKTFLPFGNGRSYGDVCLNDGGVLIDTRSLNRFIHFDSREGILRCEAGILLSEILGLIVPQGWFLPVTPGTQFVTIGGAIANDVHGKNHHQVGTFGCHVLSFELLRSDGNRRMCSPHNNSAWYHATIGGLGLTGVITWAEFQLKKIKNPCIIQESIQYPNLKTFFELSEESSQEFEYTVAWVDCLAKGNQIGKGIFIRGNHDESTLQKSCRLASRMFTVPLDPPFSLINRWSLAMFNKCYYHQHRPRHQYSIKHYVPFFYPLDTIQQWNRIYGPAGFLQYQCLIPPGPGRDGIREILARIGAEGVGSFLAVLKIFGDKRSPGLLSFPKPGVTLALDFPNHGRKTFKLLDTLDEVVRAAGGSVYPAKDARMHSKYFQQYFPEWKRLIPFIDEKFSSSFWRRVNGEYP
jgi:FAD/FMN-containing dehydrogenase